MKPTSLIQTPNENTIEEILIRKEYKAKYLSEIYNITIEKTNRNIIIHTTYYQLKLNTEQVSVQINDNIKSIDEAYEFITNIFNQNKYYIKEITSNSIILIIKAFDIIKGIEKEIELSLKENFEDKNYLIKELFNKYIKMEKDITEVKDTNMIFKEENNNLKKENNNLKMEIESIKNNQMNEINMQIMNINNIIKQIQIQLNQFNDSFQKVNQIQNQINSLSKSMNMNQSNLDNQLSLNNIQSSRNNNALEMSVTFRENSKGAQNWNIQCYSNEKIEKAIERMRNISNMNDKNVRFIYNAKRIYENILTNKQYDIANNANIFIVKRMIIKFYLSNSKEYFYLTEYSMKGTISDLIKQFLYETGLNSSEIKNFIYDKKKLNLSSPIAELGLKNNSEIFVNLKNNSIKYINIIFEINDIFDYNIFSYVTKRVTIKCLKTEKFLSVYNRFKEITSSQNKYIRFSFDLKEIDEFDSFIWRIVQSKSLEELGLRDNSIIYFTESNKFNDYYISLDHFIHK